MHSLKTIREKKGLSQRRLAQLAGVSYKTIQLLESDRKDLQISTVEKIAKALGYPSGLVEHRIESTFHLSPDSVAVLSERLRGQGERRWRLWLFNFVDAFRVAQDRNLIEMPPVFEISPKMKTLFASTVETLCAETEVIPPEWCCGIGELAEPWFVAEMESLKPMALVESPIHFRKRNIFVLGNFLERK